MKPFSIRYRKHWFSLFFSKIEGEIPDKWSELNAIQLCAVASVQKGRIDEVEFISNMLGINTAIVKRTSLFERYLLMEYFEFLKKPKACDEFKIKYLSFSVTPIWKLRTRILAPPPKLKGVTFGQFVFADTYFSIYQKDGNESDLNSFIASLYLPANAVFSEAAIQKNARIVATTDIAIREAIALNWVLINEWLVLAYPLIFRRKQELESEVPAENDDDKPVIDTNVWIKIFENFVGDDLLHDDQWAAKPVNTIFRYMTRKCKENASRKSV